MATSTKSRNSSAARPAKRSSSTKRTTPTARKAGSASARKRPTPSKDRSTTQPTNNRLGTVAKVAGGAIAAGAAVGLAARAAVRKPRRSRVLGVPMPRTWKPGSVDLKKAAKPVDLKKAAKQVDLKKVAQQVGNVAERVERTSEGVRVASQQTKRVTKRLS